MTTGSVTDIIRHGRDVYAVFDLLGRDENDLTAALGFSLSRSLGFMAGFLGAVEVPEGEVLLRMEHRDDLGRTDLELETAEDLVVVEAKRGWKLPTKKQLRQYAHRISEHGRGMLVTLSDCSAAWAADESRLPREVEGVPVRHLPWGVVQRVLANAHRHARGSERVWLSELEGYLRRAIPVTDPADSSVFVVSLNDDKPGGGGPFTFKEFVTEEGVYFHPFGWGKWPTTPRNFLAFRWAGKVQRIHRVESYEVIPSLQDRWSTIPADEKTTRPHLLHRLGPPLRFDPLETGDPHIRNRRVTALLDQLYTCDTLIEAEKASRVIMGSG